MIARLEFNDRISWRAASFMVACIAALLCVPVPGRSRTAAEETRVSAEGGPEDETRISGGSQTAGATAGALKKEDAARRAPEVFRKAVRFAGEAAAAASDDQAPFMEASGRRSKDYRLAEKEADRLVAILKTCGREEIYIWAYDREKGTTSITASAKDHQRIVALIQLLAKDQQLPAKESDKSENNP